MQPSCWDRDENKRVRKEEKNTGKAGARENEHETHCLSLLT